jgi:hypothetical protein
VRGGRGLCGLLLWDERQSRTYETEREGRVIPEGIADDEECDVGFIGVLENSVAVRLDHFAIGEYQGSAIEGFLLESQLALWHFPGKLCCSRSYQLILLH